MLCSSLLLFLVFVSIIVHVLVPPFPSTSSCPCPSSSSTHCSSSSFYCSFCSTSFPSFSLIIFLPLLFLLFLVFRLPSYFRSVCHDTLSWIYFLATSPVFLQLLVVVLFLVNSPCYT